MALKNLLPKTWRYYIRYYPMFAADQKKCKAFLKNDTEQARISQAFAACENTENIVDFAIREFETLQQREEISRLLKKLADCNAEYICEIGTYGGGTNFMLNHTIPSAKEVIGVDLYVLNRAILQHFNPQSHNMHLINGASCVPSTINKIEKILNGNKLDFCFIDGDHTYEGVKQDFLTYRHLVKEGGLIGFHDINPDHFTKYGTKTGPCTGEVPRFWSEIKDSYEHEEIIAGEDQDGYGIGVIVNNTSVLPEVLK